MGRADRLIFPIQEALTGRALDGLLLRIRARAQKKDSAAAACKLFLASLRVHCPVCGVLARILITSDNLRESCVCGHCGAFNRQRQIAATICQAAGPNAPARSLAAFARCTKLRICRALDWPGNASLIRHRGAADPYEAQELAKGTRANELRPMPTEARGSHRGYPIC
jgi:hypothetical protein